MSVRGDRQKQQGSLLGILQGLMSPGSTLSGDAAIDRQRMLPPGRKAELLEAAGLQRQPDTRFPAAEYFTGIAGGPTQSLGATDDAKARATELGVDFFRRGSDPTPVSQIPVVQDISSLLQGIRSRQRQTSANLRAIDARDSDDLGTAPTAINQQLSGIAEALGQKRNIKPMTEAERIEMEQDEGFENIFQQPSDSATTDGGSESSNANQAAQVGAAGTGAGTGDAGGAGGKADEPYNPYGALLEKAMQDVAALQGKDPNALTKEDYMKEFAEATGVNISGEPDKSHALMAFGLALMQNKAGKGFDVSKMLGAVGEAGEKAMPAFQKAKEQARTERIAAGKYALSEVKSATAARQASLKEANARVTGLLEKTVDAQTKMDLERLKQANQFEIKRQEHIYKLAEAEKEAALKGVDLYLEKTEKIDLFKDAPEIFQVEAFMQQPNLPKGTEAPVKLTNASAQKLQPQLNSAEKALNKAEQDLAEIGTDIKKGVTIQEQIMAKIGYGMRSFGIDFGSNELTPIERARYALNSIATQKTPQILGEAGKTISDADRTLVSNIVGKIDLANADEATLLMKLNEVYSLVVERGRANLDTAYDTLHSYGYDYGPYAQQQAPSGDLSEDEAAELEQLRGA